MYTIRVDTASEEDPRDSDAGAGGDCPTPEITVEQGAEVIPQTNLNLSGANSTASNGNGSAVRYEWSVVQPDGSASVFLPSNTVANPTFEANIVGQYIFRLKVWDSLDTESCSDATYTVLVASDEAIHIELTWHTPGDDDETDTGFDLFGMSVGSDLDLHFTHPNAVGIPEMGNRGWFDSFYDCYWQNTNPSWGSSAGHNPSLNRDDTDGAGPENMHLSVPEDGYYGIGVHYWDDHGFGESFATIRVYVYGDLRYEREDVRMVDRDMWEVGEIHWPGQDVHVPEEDPVIIPDYWDPMWGF